jgi:hypothetical protein
MGKGLRHAALSLYTENLQVVAAIGAADGAGVALAAVDIGVYHHMVSGFEALFVVLRDGDDLCRELMADHTGIGHQIVDTAKSADVASADAGGMQFNDGLTVLGDRLCDVLDGDAPGLFHVYSFHFQFTPLQSKYYLPDDFFLLNSYDSMDMSAFLDSNKLSQSSAIVNIMPHFL